MEFKVRQAPGNEVAFSSKSTKPPGDDVAFNCKVEQASGNDVAFSCKIEQAGVLEPTKSQQTIQHLVGILACLHDRL